MGTSKFLLILFLVCKNYAFPSSNPFGVTLREEHTRNFAKNVLEPRVTIERSASLVGEVKLYSGDASFLPTSWIFCHGQALSRTEYRHLFSVIGESFGNGDGKETFNVPDLRGRFVMGRDTSKVRTDNAANMGNTGGHATHTLMEKQLPAHSHGVGSLTVDNSGLHTHTIHDPGHTHNFNYGHWDLINGQKRVEVPINHNAHWGPLENTIQKSYTGISVFSAGNHIHALTGRTDSTGNTQSFSVLNPYQILDYIIFTGDNDHPNMNNDVTNRKCFLIKKFLCIIVVVYETEMPAGHFSIFDRMSSSPFRKIALKQLSFRFKSNAVVVHFPTV